MKSAEEILKEKYLHPLSKTEKQWIYEAMHEYADQDRWVKVSDRLPEKNGDYLVYYSGEMKKCRFKNGEWLLGLHRIFVVTHWQPLPTAPKD